MVSEMKWSHLFSMSRTELPDFHTKKHNLSKLLRVLQKMFVYFMVIWSIYFMAFSVLMLWSFSLCCGHLVYFVVIRYVYFVIIWYISPRFGMYKSKIWQPWPRNFSSTPVGARFGPHG
jgi:hypothetical protein